jgi:hypothetical protein
MFRSPISDTSAQAIPKKVLRDSVWLNCSACGIWTGFDNDDQRATRFEPSGMAWVRKVLTTNKSDLENAPGHTVGLRVVGWFATNRPLGDRIKRIVCDGLSCGEREVADNIVPAVITVVLSGAKVIFG